MYIFLAWMEVKVNSENENSDYDPATVELTPSQQSYCKEFNPSDTIKYKQWVWNQRYCYVRSLPDHEWKVLYTKWELQQKLKKKFPRIE